MAVSLTPDQRIVKLDPLSVCSIQLSSRFDNTVLSTATCFFWKEGDQTYLVTNWHNITGRNAGTLSHIDKEKLSEPNLLQFRVFINHDLNNTAIFELPIYNSDGEPLWLEHPELRNNVDVICIELPCQAAESVFPINSQAKGTLITSISDDVFIIGYPLGISVENTPIWKRGSIASELGLEVDKLPMIYVDTATSRGMSGAPVVHRASSGATEGYSHAWFSGPVSSLIGVYSGRVISSKSLEAQLAIVWKTTVITDIIRAQSRGSKNRWFIRNN